MICRRTGFVIFSLIASLTLQAPVLAEDQTNTAETTQATSAPASDSPHPAPSDIPLSQRFIKPPTNVHSPEPSGSSEGFEGTSGASGKPTLMGDGGEMSMGEKRLPAAQLSLCKVKNSQIISRSSKMTEQSLVVEAKFSDVLNKLDSFYLKKLVPEGKILANHDALLADIAAKKETVDTTRTAATQDLSTFSCTSSDPKGEISSFKSSMQTLIQALKDYRTSLKAFTQALKGLVGQTPESKTSPSSSPSASSN